MKHLRLLLAIPLLLLATPLHAQRGCFHSPEAPTDVLLLVGTAGMILGPAALRRLRRKP